MSTKYQNYFAEGSAIVTLAFLAVVALWPIAVVRGAAERIKDTWDGLRRPRYRDGV